MADITKVSTASMDVNSALKAVYVSGLFAGEALTVACPCYIASDGTVKKAVQTVKTGTNTDVIGFTAKAYASGDAVTLFGKGARFSYASDLTAGVSLFISDTAGNLTATALSTEIATGVNVADLPVAVAISATDILIVR